MAHLRNTIFNGNLKVLNGFDTKTINVVTVGSNPKFTNTNTHRII